MKTLINITRFLVYWSRYSKDFIYDLNRFVAYSNTEHVLIEDNAKLIAKIISLYHVIEKGLSIVNCRPGFGLPRVKKLIEYITMYSTRVDPQNWDIQVISSLKVLNEYNEFNKKHSITNDLLDNFLLQYSNFLEINNIDGGTKLFEINNMLKDEGISFDSVINSRSSIRNFGKENISFDVIKECVLQAQNAPSTCNRQSSRILHTKNRDLIKKLLNLQGGANGFSADISYLLIICSDLKSYQGVGDRHSGVIDASLFAMTLMYSLTKNKIANISLNWSKTAKDDIALRRLVAMPPSYSVLFFIGLGSYRDSINVPVSTKNTLPSILKEINE